MPEYRMSEEEKNESSQLLQHAEGSLEGTRQQTHGYVNANSIYDDDTIDFSPQRGKIQPQRPLQPRKKSKIPLIGTLVVLGLALGGLGSYVAAQAGGIRTVPVQQVTIKKPINNPVVDHDDRDHDGNGSSDNGQSIKIEKITDLPDNHKVVIKGDTGELKITSKADQRSIDLIPIDEHNQALASNNAARLKYEKMSDGTLLITFTLANGAAWKDDNALLVVLPDSMTVEVSTKVKVEAEHFNGNLKVTSSHGDIEVQASQGQLQLMTEQGKIDVEQFQGSMITESKMQSIKVSDSTLAGNSSWKTRGEDISISAVFQNNGSYKAESISGDIKVDIKPGSAVRVNSHTKSGKVENKVQSLTLGGTAPLVLQTESGNIEIDRD